MSMLPAANFGRGRNKVKFDVWGFYLKGEGKGLQDTVKSLKAATETRRARVRGSAMQALTFEKVSRNKVQISWPLPVSADACARVLRLALGENWRDLVTDPAGVQGARQTAAAAATAEREAAPPSVGPSGSGTCALIGAVAEEPKPEAETLATVRSPHLLSMKLEMIIGLYKDTKGSHYRELQQVYTVNWAAELGRGTYGKVYVGTNGSATDIADQDAAGGEPMCFAIKMLRDKDTRFVKTGADAVWASEEEVRRHTALGSHPNLVGLVDVGLFWEPPTRLQQLSAHIGLVCDMYEIDVRQFLKISIFTGGGMRHVLNSVLEGLRFIHGRGCIHCDLKPANIFMRGAIHLRGCFSRDRFKLQQQGEFQYHRATEFKYQIPSSFEVSEW